jgi:hypothetical protein
MAEGHEADIEKLTLLGAIYYYYYYYTKLLSLILLVMIYSGSYISRWIITISDRERRSDHYINSQS